MGALNKSTNYFKSYFKICLF